ncbi:MAG: hypothetical protein ACK559_13805, partial [bacterium]
MLPLPKLVGRGAARAQRVAGGRNHRLRVGQALARAGKTRLQPGLLLEQLVDLALACEHAVHLGVGRIVDDARARQQVSLAGHQQAAGGKPLAQPHALGKAGRDVDLCQPVGNHRLGARILATDEGAQRAPEHAQRSGRGRACGQFVY